MDFDNERSRIQDQIKVLREQAWEEDVTWPTVEAWLANFVGETDSKELEQLHSLYLLSRFTYFGQRLVREMLKSAFRDHVRAPMLQALRREHPRMGVQGLHKLLEKELAATRFVGLGNPSESGAHLLYYFRQVNYLSKNLFADLSSEFVPSRGSGRGARLEYKQVNRTVKRYIFFDDLSGSGEQVTLYLSEHLKEIRRVNPDIEFRCVVLFATSDGRAALKSLFGQHFSSIFELDETFCTFGASSRYFEKCPSWVVKDKAKAIAEIYGRKIAPKIPLGHRNGQLMLGFSHNTPDNTLPIFWVDDLAGDAWRAVFKRFDKQYA